MGWLWGSSDKSQDKLDPSLREFLSTEAPSGQKPALPQKAKPAAPSNPATTPTEQQAPETPVVPPQSAFPDGRYAHLWKNYTPQDVLEDRTKTEQDKLKDIVDAYNERKADIGRAAMENCAFEYMAQFDCFKSPNFTQMITLCRDESRKFNRCYEMQSKFLKALGYLQMDGKTPQRDEDMQMHADMLYQRMLEQEKAIEKAREEGREEPTYESLISKQNIARAMAGKPAVAPGQQARVQDDESDVWSQIKPEARREYEKKLAELPPVEQEIERQALLGELRAQQGVAKKVEVAFVEERINRMKRKEAGQATIGDTIKRLWGWDDER